LKNPPKDLSNHIKDESKCDSFVIIYDYDSKELYPDINDARCVACYDSKQAGLDEMANIRKALLSQMRIWTIGGQF